VDETVSKDPRHIATLIGAQRFIMIGGEPSASDQVARIFDGSRVLLTMLLDLARFAGATAGQGLKPGATQQPYAGVNLVSAASTRSQGELPAGGAPSIAEAETPLATLAPMLAGNIPLTCRLFRVLFEHLLGFALTSPAPQASISLVNDLTGSREHSRSFLATALYIVGAEIDRENLMAFMMRQGLFGVPMLENLLQNRDYCDAFYTFRRLNRAFMESPEVEEGRLRNRLDQLNVQLGGKASGEKLFETADQDKARIDAYLAATDLLDAMTLTPWCMSLIKAVSQDASYSIRLVVIIAGHFERFARREATRDQANREIADHLLAFGRQFSADRNSAQPE
jgi:hypothetical protein